MFENLDRNQHAYLRSVTHALAYGAVPAVLEAADLETGPYLCQVLDALAHGEAPMPNPRYAYEQRLTVARSFFARTESEVKHYDLLTTSVDDIEGDEHARKRFRIMQLYAQPSCKGWSEIAREIGVSTSRIQVIAAKQFRKWAHPSFFDGYCYFGPSYSGRHQHFLRLKHVDRVDDTGRWREESWDGLSFPEVVRRVNAHLAQFGTTLTVRVKPPKPVPPQRAEYRASPRDALWYIQRAIEGESLSNLARLTGVRVFYVNILVEQKFKEQQTYAEQMRMPYIVKRTRPCFEDRYFIVDRHGNDIDDGLQLTAMLRRLTVELRNRDIEPPLYWTQAYTTPWPF